MLLDRDFCTYVVTSTDGVPRRIFGFYANVPSPSEGYFQTLLCASPFAETLVSDSLRFAAGVQRSGDEFTLDHVQVVSGAGAIFAEHVRSSKVAAALREKLGAAQQKGDGTSADKIRSRLRLAWQKRSGCRHVEVHHLAKRVALMNA